MTTYHLARGCEPNDTIVYLSTPQSDIDELQKLASEAEARLLRAALGRGRASPEYAAALVDYNDAQASLVTAVSRVDPTVQNIVLDSVLLTDDEYLTVRFTGPNVVEVGRAGYGSSRASHSAGTPVYPAALRVTAEVSLEVVFEGSPVAGGSMVDLTMAFDGRMTGFKIVADQAGDLVLDVRKASPFPAIPAPGDSVVGAAFPTLSASQTYDDQVLPGWDVDFLKDDVVRIVVLSAATITRATAVLEVATSV